MVIGRNVGTSRWHLFWLLIPMAMIVAVSLAVATLGSVDEAEPKDALAQVEAQDPKVRSDQPEGFHRARSLRDRAETAVDAGDHETAATYFLEAAAALENEGPQHVASRLSWTRRAMRSFIQAADLESASECFWKIQMIFDEEGIGTFSKDQLDRMGTSMDEQFRARVPLYRIGPAYSLVHAHVVRAMDEKRPLMDRVDHLALAQKWIEVLVEQIDRYEEHVPAEGVAAYRENTLPQSYGVLAQIARSFVTARPDNVNWKKRWNQLAHEYAQIGLDFCDPPGLCNSTVYGEIMMPLADVILDRASDWDEYADAITELVQDLDQQPLLFIQHTEIHAMKLAYRFFVTEDASVGRDAIRLNRLVTDLAEQWYPHCPDQVPHYFVALMRQLRIHAHFDERGEARHALERAMMSSRPSRYDTELQQWRAQLMPERAED